MKATKAFVAHCTKMIDILLRIGLSPDDIEKLAPPPVNSSTSEWSVSLEEVSRRADDDDDDDEDEDVFKTFYVCVTLLVTIHCNSI